MAMTIEELSGILTRNDIKHSFDTDGDIFFGYETEKYIRSDGNKSLGLFLSVANEGRMFSLTAHDAFSVKGSKHIGAFLKLCSIIQMNGYLIQFEYVPTRGAVRACIEVPLLDNKLTKAQLDFCIAAMLKMMEEFYEPLQKALQTGSLEGLPEEWLKAMSENESSDTTTL